MKEVDFRKAEEFILSTARPLEKAFYRYLFEGGSKQAVISELSAYQNPDGGFGHGLEADNWNPASNPIAVNDAIILLDRIFGFGEAEEMVSGIVRYLESGDSFDKERKRWLFAIESNKDWPHAVWWEKKGDGIMNYNPTVSLAAFMVCFGGGDRSFYADIIKDAVGFLSETEKVSGDELKCFMLCSRLLAIYGDADTDGITDADALWHLIIDRIARAICPDTGKYGVEYVPVPSDFYAIGRGAFTDERINALAKAEAKVLGGLQKDDGGFDITWQWYTPYSEFGTAVKWWRPRVTIDKLEFARFWRLRL